MNTPQKTLYMQIAHDYTESELAEKLQVHPRTIRRYAQQTGIKPKPTHFTNREPADRQKEFNTLYAGIMELQSDFQTDNHGHTSATCRCLRCGTTWRTRITAKMQNQTGCIRCDKGNHGNKYDAETVTQMLNTSYAGQWKLITYGHYSKKDSVIQCTLCGKEQTVNLADFINTTTKRCTQCQTGSFGEHVIATTLIYNNITFEREKTIAINGHKYRLDFLIDNTFAIEYSGAQHFEKGLYYNEEINTGVKQKEQWAIQHGYQFFEIQATYNITSIIDTLSQTIRTSLKTPSPEFFRTCNPDMQRVLSYMKTHSARQTMKDLNITVNQLKKYVKLDGYQSISDWQSDNKID